MKSPVSATQVLQQAPETKPSTENILTYAHSEECFDAIWTGLQSARLISDKWVIGGIDYGNWRQGMADMNDRHLMEGLKLANNHQGFFQMGHFRHYCIEGYSQHVERQRRATELPPYPKNLEDLRKRSKGRFKELMEVTIAMSREEGRGPIGKATEAGLLSTEFVRDKSSQEIIDYCKKLYGE